jgi:hypothetical protein
MDREQLTCHASIFCILLRGIKLLQDLRLRGQREGATHVAEDGKNLHPNSEELFGAVENHRSVALSSRSLSRS